MANQPTGNTSNYDKVPAVAPLPADLRAGLLTGRVGRIMVPQDKAASLGLVSGEPLRVRLGSTGGFVAHVVVCGDGTTICLEPPAPSACGWRLPAPGLMLAFDDSPERGPSALCGPIIGVLTSSTKVMAGPQGGTIRALMRAGRRARMLVYAFTPGDVAWSRGLVRGYVFHPSRGWVRQVVPLPQVVYNRLPTRTEEHRPAAAEAIRRLAARRIPVFNAGFMDKWRVLRALQRDEAVTKCVPRTALWRGPRAFEASLVTNAPLFLKPVADSLGRGAMRITHRGGLYLWEGNVPGRGTRRRTFSSAHAVAAFTASEIGSRPYVVQQCIPLARANGRAFDVRALVQRMPGGTWQTTGLAARLAMPGRITTHIPNGGMARSVSATLLAAGLPETVESELASVAENAAAAATACGTGLYGEVSLDIGVDPAGHPWVFEVNAKPFRFDEPRIRLLAQRRVLEYAASVAGFS